jgi:hypothetical protein
MDTLAGDGFVVAYPPGDSLRAERMLRMLLPRPRLLSLPDSLPTRAVVHLAPDEEGFQALIGSRPPEWGAAVAIPARQAIVLPAYPTRRLGPEELPRVLRHEWAHLALHEYLGNLRVPRWFSEGYAEWASGGWRATEAWKLRVAIALDRAPALDSLELSWPRDRAQAEVAYLLAGSAVAYLARNGGEEGVALFLERWRDSGRFEESLRRTYGVTIGQLEEDWKKHVRSEYGWLLVLSRSMLFWGLLAGALGGMLIIRRRYNRMRLASLRATEPPDLPAFWAENLGSRGPMAPTGPPPTPGGPGGAPTGGSGPVASWGEPLTPESGPTVQVIRPLIWRRSRPESESESPNPDEE